jgi:glycosyltransferase involved in cell wall biosynthesis
MGTMTLSRQYPDQASSLADVFVVIPAYNEGPVLSQTVAGLLHYGFTIVVVDDGSRLPASAFLEGMPVHYLRHLVNLGQGAALQTGMDYALKQGASIIVHFDADGQHSPELISRLIGPIRSGECDVVMGSRFIDPRDTESVPRTKRLTLKVGILVSWIFSGLWLTDTHNGFRALSAKAASRFRMTEDGYAHATEILEHIRKSGLRYKEIPATIRYTEHSLAKGQSVFNSVNILFDLVIRKLSQ